jgi:hypothetical protein
MSENYLKNTEILLCCLLLGEKCSLPRHEDPTLSQRVESLLSIPTQYDSETLLVLIHIGENKKQGTCYVSMSKGSSLWI